MSIKKRIFSLMLAASVLVSLAACGENAGGNELPADAGTSNAQGTTEPELSPTVTVTIIEGQAMVQIFEQLEQEGVCSFDALMSSAQNTDFTSYPLIGAIPGDVNRCFVLEGYIFPDTYEFYRGENADSVIRRFLDNAENRITDAHRQRAAEMGISIDEIITTASIVQKEGSKPSEVANIAGVIYNRLDTGMQLQMDTSIFYIEQYVKPYIDGDINRYNSYYNTYKCPGLPIGPLCNPGLQTIEAALYPADVPYLYFCHDSEANYYYAESYEEHLVNCETAGC